MGDKTELVVKSAIYTTYGSVGRVDRWHREQSVARSGNVRTWATPDPGASEFVRCAISGLIAQLCTGVRKRPFSPPFHRPTGIIPSKLNGLRLPPGRFRFLVDLDSGGVLYLMPEASTRRIPTRRPADERPEDFT